MKWLPHEGTSSCVFQSVELGNRMGVDPVLNCYHDNTDCSISSRQGFDNLPKWPRSALGVTIVIVQENKLTVGHF